MVVYSGKLCQPANTTDPRPPDNAGVMDLDREAVAMPTSCVLIFVVEALIFVLYHIIMAFVLKMPEEFVGIIASLEK